MENAGSINIYIKSHSVSLKLDQFSKSGWMWFVVDGFRGFFGFLILFNRKFWHEQR